MDWRRQAGCDSASTELWFSNFCSNRVESSTSLDRQSGTLPHL